MQTDRLAAADLGRLAEGADVELAVQPRRRVVREELEWKALGERRAEPLGGRKPSRVPRAVVVTEAGDRRGEDLELAARRAQRHAFRIAAEPLEQHQVVVGAVEL